MIYSGISFIPSYKRNVTPECVSVQSVFTKEESDKVIKFGKEFIFYKATTLKEGVNVNDPGKVKDYRQSNIAFFTYNEASAWIFVRVADLVAKINSDFYGFELNGFSCIQFTEYKAEESGHYDWHMDTVFGAVDSENNGMRKLSVSIVLNEDFEGGDFQLHVGRESGAKTQPLKTGDGLIFPSFIPHKVSPVTSGARYSLVVWVCGPKFR
jgi:PKHD-type hydroxylase